MIESNTSRQTMEFSKEIGLDSNRATHYNNVAYQHNLHSNEATNSSFDIIHESRLVVKTLNKFGDCDSINK